MALSTSVRQLEVDERNIAFWDELCGTQSAKSLGVVDNSPESLAKFDQWYLEFYPYLCRHVPVGDLAGKTVLEVGLGYGTLATVLMERGASYQGLDIAAGPVEMATYRADLLNKKADIRQGSILECPFPEASVDYVVSIGCLHHTGDLGHAIDEVHRVLKPGGAATIMVYNALSYRQWLVRPWQTFRLAISGDGRRLPMHIAEKKALDINQDGEAAPETAFVSKRQLQYLCRVFATVEIRQEHIHAELLFKKVPRGIALRLFGPWLGLNLYTKLRKQRSAAATDAVNQQFIRRAS